MGVSIAAAEELEHVMLQVTFLFRMLCVHITCDARSGL
jgi:hypothetical protein